MDLLTTIAITAALVVVAARVVELASKRPDAFAGLFEGAQPFATAALRESAEMRRIGHVVADIEPANDSVRPTEEEDRPAMAA